MTKSELIELVATYKELTKRQSEEVVTTLFGELATTLRTGGHVEIRGFGSFYVKDYKLFIGHNPKTGEFVSVEAKKLPIFKTSGILKKRIE
ncbi:MAG: HU family DNA-binding protein [Desulfuromonadales bacterium]